MSRRRGRRDRPAPERRAIRERYEKPERGRRTRLTDRPGWDRPISVRRRWAAVLAGTVVSILAFSFVAIAIVRVDEGDGVAAAASGVGAAVLVPVLVLVVGFVSRAESPWRTAALWSPIAIVAFVAVVLAAREPATGYVLATGLGAAFAMRSEAGVHHRSWRVWTAVGLAVYTKIVFVLSPGLAILAAPLLPVAGIAIIDSVAERSGRPGRGHRSAH